MGRLDHRGEGDGRHEDVDYDGLQLTGYCHLPYRLSHHSLPIYRSTLANFVALEYEVTWRLEHKGRAVIPALSHSSPPRSPRYR